MWRAIFFASGLFVAMWGGTFLMVDEMVLVADSDPEPQRSEEFRGLFMSKNADDKKVFNPPEWAAFTLMSIGTVTMLYSVALPKRQHH